MTDKIVTPQQVDLEARKNKFMAEVDKLGIKYRIQVEPQLAYTRDGILPVLAIKDRIPTLNPSTLPQTEVKE